MKKFLVTLCIILSINSISYASQYSQILDKLENSLYGFTYTTSDDISRLDRIEESGYGQKKSNQNIQSRISALNKDMSAELLGQEIKPKEDTFAEEDDYRETIAQEKMPPAGANVDYPSINELEREVFKQEYKNQDLNSRLAKLEKQTFGQSYDNDAFSSRVERLQAKIKPKSFMDNSIAQDANEYYSEDSIPLDRNYNLSEYQSPEFDYDAYNARNTRPKQANIGSVEKSIFKRSFDEDSMDNRLSRLESTMFGTTFNNDTDSDRINRISSAYKAQKTANKYDSNKFSQNMATAMQIGTILLMILACVL